MTNTVKGSIVQPMNNTEEITYIPTGRYMDIFVATVNDVSMGTVSRSNFGGWYAYNYELLGPERVGPFATRDSAALHLVNTHNDREGLPSSD